MVYFGIILIVASVVLGMLAGFVIGAAAPDLLPLLLIVIGLAVIGGSILCLIGPFYCLAVPPEARASELIMGSIVLQVIALVCAIAQRFAAAQTAILLGSIQQIAGLVASILFLLFLQKLSLFIQRPDLAGRAKSALTLSIAAAVLIGLAVAGILAGIPALALLALIGLIVSLVFLIKYVNLLQELKPAILNFARNPPAS